VESPFWSSWDLSHPGFSPVIIAKAARFAFVHRKQRPHPDSTSDPQGSGAGLNRQPPSCDKKGPGTTQFAARHPGGRFVTGHYIRRVPRLSGFDGSFASEALKPLTSYLEIPCLSPAYDPDWESGGHVERAVQFLADWAVQRHISGLQVEIRRLPGRTPLLLCEVPSTVRGGAETVVLYGHFDKQPPLGVWSPGLDPFRGVLKDDRLYGRGAVDDGYSLFCALLAIEAAERDGRGHGRCLVIVEGSEESASPDLGPHVEALGDRLKGVDLIICLDSSSPTYDRLWMTQSLRGNVVVTVDVSVLERGVHSGSAAGVAPSPFRVLCRLLDRLEDRVTGEVKLNELTAEPPAEHRRRLAAVADELGDVVAAALPTLQGVRLAGEDATDRLLRQAWSPAMSVVGMDGIPPSVSGGNVVHASTRAKISFRISPSVDADAAADAIVAALMEEAPSGAHVSVTTHSPASGWCCPEVPAWLASALREASVAGFDREPGWTSEGGTIPFMSLLGHRFPKAGIVATGVLGPGSNAHGIDENLYLPAADALTIAVAGLIGAHAERMEETAL